MPIPLACAACGVRLKAPEAAVGQKIKCPKCGTAVVVPPSAPPSVGTPGQTTTDGAPRQVSTPGGRSAQAGQPRRASAEASTPPGAAETDRKRPSLAEAADGDVQQSVAGQPSDDGGSGSSTVDEGPPGRRGPYALTRLHAQGGIGQVWLARDSDLGREVALKELQPGRVGDAANRRRFLAEAQITGQLEHPGVVPVYSLVREADGVQPFYTMRFIRGRTLSRAARAYHKKRARGEAGPLDLMALLNAFVGVCNAVAYAHSRGVVHRDLKGPNIVLGDFGEVVVLDWGMAKLVGRPDAEGDAAPVTVDEAAGPDGTVAGQVLGTPAYMAPEQARGRQDRINERTDVYGLGAVLYEILTGEAPFAGPDTQQVLQKVLEEEPARPREVVPAVPRALEAVCLKALAKRPADRYASAAELAADVQRWLADEPVRAHREGPARRLARWGRRHPTLVTAAALVLLAVGAGGLWVKRDRDVRAAEVAREAAEEAARKEGLVLAELQEATQRVRGANLDGAREAVERAQQRLTGGADDLQQRVRQARADLEMVERLEGVLLLETFTAGKHENALADAGYGRAFREYGLDLLAVEPAEAAERIKAAAIRDQLVTALDDWLFVKPQADTAGRERLLSVVRQADADAWRQRLRDPVTRKDRAALEDLARQPDVASQPPAILVHLGKYLAQAGAWSAAVGVLQQAQHRYPADFWVNYALALSLSEQRPPQTDKAVGFFRAALAVRPLSRIAHLGLGRQLLLQRHPAEAFTHFRRADQLKGQGEPGSLDFLIYLGDSMLQKAEYAESAAYLKAARELAGPQDPRAQPLAAAAGTADKMARLTERLPAILRGEAAPADATEKVLLARICLQKRRLPATAARFFKEAFAAESALADDMIERHRYLAARAAALAGTGKGEDGAKLSAKEQAGWRKQALRWLRADLRFWNGAAHSGQGQVAVAVQRILRGSQTEADLQGVRQADALAGLPPDEELAWQSFWREVEDLIRQVGGKAGAGR
jgi:tRNA A-37 threonylcarbamoyl transferase component Bud32